MKVAASTPKGSDFSEGLRAVRGQRMPERTRVSLASCLGMKTLKREPEATKSTMPGTRPARLSEERKGAAFCAD